MKRLRGNNMNKDHIPSDGTERHANTPVRRRTRADHEGATQTAYKNARKKILASQDICGICGQPVNKKLKWPHPLSPTVDHIIPVSKKGNAVDIGNMQLAHWICNRRKSDKLTDKVTFEDAPRAVSNRLLPQTFDWKNL